MAIQYGISSEKKIIVEYVPPFTVKLMYFKGSGKYYSEGEYKSGEIYIHNIFKEVRYMAESGNLPGLVEGTKEFHILVNVQDHPHSVPGMIMYPYSKE